MCTAPILPRSATRESTSVASASTLWVTCMGSDHIHAELPLRPSIVDWLYPKEQHSSHVEHSCRLIRGCACEAEISAGSKCLIKKLSFSKSNRSMEMIDRSSPHVAHWRTKQQSPPTPSQSLASLSALGSGICELQSQLVVTNLLKEKRSLCLGNMADVGSHGSGKGTSPQPGFSQPR